MKYVTTYAEAKRILRNPGTRVYVAIHGAPDVLVEVPKKKIWELITEQEYYGKVGPEDIGGDPGRWIFYSVELHISGSF